MDGVFSLGDIILLDGNASASGVASGAAPHVPSPVCSRVLLGALLVTVAIVAGLAWRFRSRLGLGEFSSAGDHVRGGESDRELCSSDDDGSDDAAKSSEEGELSSTSAALQVTLLIVMWWGASIYVTLMVKLTAIGSTPHPMVHGGHVGHRAPPVLPPFLMTSMVNVVVGLFAWVVARALFQPKRPFPSPTRPEVLRILALGAIGGCEIGCLNKSLQYITISERTMLQNSNILLMMICAQVFGLESLTILRVAAGLLLVGGGVLQGLASSQQHRHGSHGERSPEQESEHLRGLVFMLTSMLLTSSKWSLIQCVTQRNEPESFLGRISKLHLGATVQPITGLVCFFLAIYFEADAIFKASTWHSPLLWRVPMLAFGIVIIMGSELKLVQLTSAVATGVLMNLHHIPMVLVGVVFFQDEVTMYSILGFGLCLLGGFVYAAARSFDGGATQE